MLLKKIKAATPSQRHLKLIDKSFLSKNKPLKSQTIGLITSGGRNNLGRITHFRKGGGHKKLYRKIDFLRKDSNGIVLSLEYDPNRTAFIASVYDVLKKQPFYILAPQGLKTGDIIQSGKHAEVKIAHSLPLARIPVGTFIHNISLSKGKKGKIARAAGNYAQLIQKNNTFGRIILRSGEQRLISVECTATIGILSNENKNLTSLGKAGRSIWLNRRPTVRGVAMNPVDHPHGGGEGKTSGGRPSVTPWGKPARGQSTSRSKSPLVVVSRKISK
jgi:large subunit ribosomal protein L2